MGLSPHVRGNRRARCQGRFFEGSIPACTGKPRCGPLRSRAPRVYPRMYGETLGGSIQHRGGSGLSPHVRGNQQGGAVRRAQDGSIPACTGKPSLPPGCRSSERVYPRMYGETQAASYNANVRRGLSPHVRGNPRRFRYVFIAQGSIPACTGKPMPLSAAPPAQSVYPRMYGETSPDRYDALVLSGLSPHVRGNLGAP